MQSRQRGHNQTKIYIRTQEQRETLVCGVTRPCPNEIRNDARFLSQNQAFPYVGRTPSGKLKVDPAMVAYENEKFALLVNPSSPRRLTHSHWYDPSDFPSPSCGSCDDRRQGVRQREQAAIAIQSCVRGYLTRSRICKMKRAAKSIKDAIREFQFLYQKSVCPPSPCSPPDVGASFDTCCCCMCEMKSEGPASGYQPPVGRGGMYRGAPKGGKDQRFPEEETPSNSPERQTSLYHKPTRPIFGENPNDDWLGQDQHEDDSRPKGSNNDRSTRGKEGQGRSSKPPQSTGRFTLPLPQDYSRSHDQNDPRSTATPNERANNQRGYRGKDNDRSTRDKEGQGRSSKPPQSSGRFTLPHRQDYSRSNDQNDPRSTATPNEGANNQRGYRGKDNDRSSRDKEGQGRSSKPPQSTGRFTLPLPQDYSRSNDQNDPRSTATPNEGANNQRGYRGKDNDRSSRDKEGQGRSSKPPQSTGRFTFPLPQDYSRSNDQNDRRSTATPNTGVNNQGGSRGKEDQSNSPWKNPNAPTRNGNDQNERQSTSKPKGGKDQGSSEEDNGKPNRWSANPKEYRPRASSFMPKGKKFFDPSEIEGDDRSISPERRNSMDLEDNGKPNRWSANPKEIRPRASSFVPKGTKFFDPSEIEGDDRSISPERQNSMYGKSSLPIFKEQPKEENKRNSGGGGGGPAKRSNHRGSPEEENPSNSPERQTSLYNKPTRPNFGENPNEDWLGQDRHEDDSRPRGSNNDRTSRVKEGQGRSYKPPQSTGRFTLPLPQDYRRSNDQNDRRSTATPNEGANDQRGSRGKEDQSNSPWKNPNAPKRNLNDQNERQSTSKPKGGKDQGSSDEDNGKPNRWSANPKEHRPRASSFVPKGTKFFDPSEIEGDDRSISPERQNSMYRKSSLPIFKEQPKEENKRNSGGGGGGGGPAKRSLHRGTSEVENPSISPERQTSLYNKPTRPIFGENPNDDWQGQDQHEDDSRPRGSNNDRSSRDKEGQGRSSKPPQSTGSFTLPLPQDYRRSNDQNDRRATATPNEGANIQRGSPEEENPSNSPERQTSLYNKPTPPIFGENPNDDWQGQDQHENDSRPRGSNNDRSSRDKEGQGRSSKPPQSTGSFTLPLPQDYRRSNDQNDRRATATPNEEANNQRGSRGKEDQSNSPERQTSLYNKPTHPIFGENPNDDWQIRDQHEDDPGPRGSNNDRSSRDKEGQGRASKPPQSTGSFTRPLPHDSRSSNDQNDRRSIATPNEGANNQRGFPEEENPSNSPERQTSLYHKPTRPIFGENPNDDWQGRDQHEDDPRPRGSNNDRSSRDKEGQGRSSKPPQSTGSFTRPLPQDYRRSNDQNDRRATATPNEGANNQRGSRGKEDQSNSPWKNPNAPKRNSNDPNERQSTSKPKGGKDPSEIEGDDISISPERRNSMDLEDNGKPNRWSANPKEHRPRASSFVPKGTKFFDPSEIEGDDRSISPERQNSMYRKSSLPIFKEQPKEENKRNSGGGGGGGGPAKRSHHRGLSEEEIHPSKRHSDKKSSYTDPKKNSKDHNFPHTARDSKDSAAYLDEGLNVEQDSILLFGGADPTHHVSQPGENTGMGAHMYKLNSFVWLHVGMLPEPRTHFGMVKVGNEVFIIGGTDPRFKSIEGRSVVCNSVWKVNLRSGEWYFDTYFPADLESPRSHFGCVAIAKTIYAIGGNDSERGGLSSCVKYDTISDCWTSISRMDTPRVSFGIAVHDNRIWVAGGLTKLPTNPILDSVVCYDTTSDRWSHVAALPVPRAFFPLVAAHGHLYVVGGVVPKGGGREGHESTKDILRYEPGEHTWMEIGGLVTKRHAHSATAVGHRIVAVGGANSDNRSILDSLEIFDLSTSTSHESTTSPICRLTGAGIIPLAAPTK